MRGQPSVAHVCTETIIMFLKCSDIMSDQVHAWTDIGQDKSDMETFCSLCSQSVQFFSIIEHNSCIPGGLVVEVCFHLLVKADL